MPKGMVKHANPKTAMSKLATKREMDKSVAQVSLSAAIGMKAYKLIKGKK